jgi:bisphosphoglycerate-independent phosphoglycerate mutase (AlkP superfamily)
MNHIDSNRAFESLSEAIIKVESSDFANGQSFSNSVIHSLKAYQAKNKRLPRSFTPENVRNLYLNLKSLNQSEQLRISEKTAEYLLYLFKINKMTAESIDLCHSFQSLVKGYDTEEQAK